MKFLRDILTIIIKNFKLLIRSKSSALVVIFGPLLIVLLLGLAFNTSGVYDINVGVYSNSYSDLSDGVIDQLKDERYVVTKINTEEKCIDGVKHGDSHICLVFPENMVINNEITNNIVFYIDYSRVNLVYAIMDSVNKKLTNKSEELSLGMTQVLVDKLQEAKNELTNKEPTLNTLSTNNADLLAKVDTGYNTINSFKFGKNFTDLNISGLDDEIFLLQEEYNDTFITLKDLLDEFEERIGDIFFEFDKMKNFKDTFSGDLESMKTTLEQDKSSIVSVKTGITTVVSGISSVGVTKAENIVSPFKTEIKPVTPEKTHLGNMFPSMVVLVIMFVSIILASTMVIRERKTKAYFRNFITPTSDIVFLIGDFITNLLLVLIQLGIVFGVAGYFFRGELVDVLLNTVGVVFLVISLFVLIGMVLGYLFNNQETTTLGAMFVSSIFLFFSNTILPLESLTGKFKDVALFNPFVVSENVLRELILFNVNIKDVLYYIYILVGFIIVFALLLVILRLIKKREFK